MNKRKNLTPKLLAWISNWMVVSLGNKENIICLSYDMLSLHHPGMWIFRYGAQERVGVITE